MLVISICVVMCLVCGLVSYVGWLLFTLWFFLLNLVCVGMFWVWFMISVMLV